MKNFFEWVRIGFGALVLFAIGTAASNNVAVGILVVVVFFGACFAYGFWRARRAQAAPRPDGSGLGPEGLG